MSEAKRNNDLTLETIQKHMVKGNLSCESKIVIIQVYYLPYILDTLRNIFIKEQIRIYISEKKAKGVKEPKYRNPFTLSELKILKFGILKDFQKFVFPPLNDQDLIYLMENYTFERDTKQIFYVLKEMISSFYSLDDTTKQKLLDMPHHLFIITLCEHYCIKFSLFPFLSIDSLEEREVCGNIDPNLYSITVGSWAVNRNMRGILIYKMRFSECGCQGSDQILPKQDNADFSTSLEKAKIIAWKYTPLDKKKHWVNILQRKKSLAGDTKKINTLPSITLEYIAFNSLMKNTLTQGMLMGKSGGFAQCIAIFSLFNSLRLTPDIIFMGVLKDNGLIGRVEMFEIKILACLRAGINIFYISKDNRAEMIAFIERNKTNFYYTSKICNLKYKCFEHIKEVLKEIKANR